MAYFEGLMNEITQESEALKQKLLLKQNKTLPFLAEEHEHEEVKKRWVVNASQHDLKDNEVQLLRKGLNFALTPNHVPRKKIIASVEQSLVGLSEETKDEIRVEVSHILKHANPPKDNNTTTEERRALRDLKQNSDIVVLPADKGNAVVVLNKSDYRAGVTSMLQENVPTNKG